jgi:hypothetical protein
MVNSFVAGLTCFLRCQLKLCREIRFGVFENKHVKGGIRSFRGWHRVCAETFFKKSVLPQVTVASLRHHNFE